MSLAHSSLGVLPNEILLHILGYVVPCTLPIWDGYQPHPAWKHPWNCPYDRRSVSVLRTCRLLHELGAPLLYSRNVFSFSVSLEGLRFCRKRYRFPFYRTEEFFSSLSAKTRGLVKYVAVVADFRDFENSVVQGILTSLLKFQDLVASLGGLRSLELVMINGASEDCVSIRAIACKGADAVREIQEFVDLVKRFAETPRTSPESSSP